RHPGLGHRSAPHRRPQQVAAAGPAGIAHPRPPTAAATSQPQETRWACTIPTRSPLHRRCAMSSERELPAEVEGPVTTTVTRRIRPGQEAAYEEFLAGISSAARAFPGYLGIEVFRPAPGASDEYRTVYRFDSSAHLYAWLASPERAAWLQRAEP